MPELPEVEYARRQLSRWLVGATIVRARILDPRILDEVSGPQFSRALGGRRVQSVERRGKWLRIVLDEGLVFSHLGMTGKWVRSNEAQRFERLTLEVLRRKLTSHVRYLDPRLFGRVLVAKTNIPAWIALGPDPLHDGLDVAALFAKLARRSGPIKPTLLDQSLIAGIGNIQAVEALWNAKLDPRRRSSSLDRREVSALVRGIMKSLARTLALQSGPKISYVEEAGAANPFLVYERGGEPCPRCKHRLEKITMAGRGTVFCPRCQR